MLDVSLFPFVPTYATLKSVLSKLALAIRFSPPIVWGAYSGVVDSSRNGNLTVARSLWIASFDNVANAQPRRLVLHNFGQTCHVAPTNGRGVVAFHGSLYFWQRLRTLVKRGRESRRQGGVETIVQVCATGFVS